MSLKAAALQFALANPAVAAGIPGASKPERLAEDRQAAQEVIPPDSSAKSGSWAWWRPPHRCRSMNPRDSRLLVRDFLSRKAWSPSIARCLRALQGAVMVQQCVASREQEAIGFRLVQIQCQLQRLDPVHTQTPRLDDTLVGRARQRPERASARFVETGQPLVAMKILCDIVYQTISTRSVRSRLRLSSSERSVASAV